MKGRVASGLLIVLIAVACCFGCSSPQSRFEGAFEEIETDSLHIYELYYLDTVDATEKPLAAIPDGPAIDTADFFEVTGVKTEGIDSIWGGYKIPAGENSNIYLFHSQSNSIKNEGGWNGRYWVPNDTGLTEVESGSPSIFLMVADSGFSRIDLLVVVADRWSVKSADADTNSWLLDLDEDGDLDLVIRRSMMQYGAVDGIMEEKGWSMKKAIRETTLDFLETYMWENEGFGPPTDRDIKKKEMRFRFKALLVQGYYRKSWEYPF